MANEPYKVAQFKDGSTAVLARRVRLGKAVFYGTMDECLWHQDHLAEPHAAAAAAAPASGAARAPGVQAAPYRVAIGDAVRPLVDGYFGLQGDRWYTVNYIGEPNDSPLWSLGFEGVPGSFPLYATADLEPAFVRYGDDLPVRSATPRTQELGPLRNGELVRAVNPALGLPAGWLRVHHLFELPFSKALLVAVAPAPGLHRWLDDAGQPNFERWFAVQS